MGHKEYAVCNCCVIEKKQESTMKVSYNGFAGILLKIETCSSKSGLRAGMVSYSLDIWDAEKDVTYSFSGVKLSDVKFLGGAVSFGG